MNRNDGGYAFPINVDREFIGGMSLRDWFAGMALQSIAASWQPSNGDIHAEHCAELCYQFADAMLAEREK